MANSTFSLRPAPYGNRAEIGGLGGGRIHWTMSPEVTWVCRVRYTDLADADQSTVVTIPALTDSGRLTGTFTLGASVVEVTADLADGNDQDALATDFAVALLAQGAPFSAWIADATPGPGSGEVTIEWNPGIGLVSQSYAYEPAQVIALARSGSVAAGDHVYTFTGAGLGAPVVVTVPIAVGTSAAAFGAAVEAAIEGEAGLSGVVISADDDGAGDCSVLFAPGLAAASIAVEVPAIPHSYEITTGGAPADGDYTTTFISELLPAPVPVTVTRAAGTPATNALLAAAREAAIEAQAQLAPFVVSADDTGAVNAVETYTGVAFTFQTSAPSGATLVVVDVSEDEPEVEASDATPAAPTITQSHDLALSLNDLSPFSAHACRLECPLVRRVVAWSATATVSLDNAGAASTDVLTAVSVSSGTGYLGDTGTSLGDVDVPEEAWDPRLVITTATLAPTAGEFEIHVGFCPLPN
jgi:hypothetical protein